MKARTNLAQNEQAPMSKRKPAPPPTPAAPVRVVDRRLVDFVDVLTLELEQADALVGLIADRLAALDEDDSGSELYALSLIAEDISEKHQRLLTRTKVFFAADGAR